jgi:hypothetical protein
LPVGLLCSVNLNGKRLSSGTKQENGAFEAFMQVTSRPQMAVLRGEDS